MAKFAIMASELKSLKKSMEDRKLAELKKEIIEILKKQDEKDFKKAIDYFESQELHFTHLEKSLNGKWIEKAGYGIGTVRIWKGKKYKKIAPGKWARVFDKEGRGTNIAIGKLIAKVQKIDNVEDLMAFVMQNKQRFVDENGVDLPVLDKLRAAVDARNGNVGSKEKTVEDRIKENPDYPFKPKTDKERAERAAFEKDRDDFIERMDKIRQENKKKDSKPAEKKEDENKTYWIQDFEGNRITSDDAKNKIKSIKDKLEYMESMKEGRSKDVVVSIDTSIRQLENYRDDLISKLNPEDRKEIESETEKKSKTEENKESPKKEKNEKIYRVNNSGKVISFDELQPIATNKSVGENEVQLPYSKELADEIESLKNCAAPEWENREFMKHVYYDEGNLVTTDGRRLKIVKVGKLDGIQDGTYVDITTDKSGINIKKREGMEDYKFPTYKKVMPDNLSQNVTLDSKLVKEKIKAMQKDGAIDKKGANIVQLEFRDGKVFIDDTAVGDAKDIQLKTSEGWNDPKEDTNYVHFNADYLTNALSGKTAVLQMGEDNHKAMAINTGSTSNVLMPMHGLNAKMDYGQGRQAKKDANDKKAEERKKNKDYNYELLKDVREGKLTSSQVERVAKNIDNKLSSFTDEELQREWARLNYDVDKGFEKKALKSINDIIDKKINLSGLGAIAYSMLKERHPEVKEKFVKELEKRGITVKKSLFDDFIVDVFEANDEEEIEDELYEGETEYNDYSAEQPELFNSTAMKVREALDRINNQVL